MAGPLFLWRHGRRLRCSHKFIDSTKRAIGNNTGVSRPFSLLSFRLSVSALMAASARLPVTRQAIRRMAWRAAWGYMALVLLLAPLLGLMHGVVHGAGGGLPAVQTHAYDGSHSVRQATESHGWLADLFAAHTTEADCRVYDQLCHSGGVATPPALVLPVVLTSFVFHFLEGEVLARRAALFEARGPPLTR